MTEKKRACANCEEFEFDAGREFDHVGPYQLTLIAIPFEMCGPGQRAGNGTPTEELWCISCLSEAVVAFKNDYDRDDGRDDPSTTDPNGTFQY